MKHLLCFGDSNTWGYVPGSGQRFPLQVRWPGVLQARLGSHWRVIEEGLNGRTTIHQDPERDGRNGRLFLGPLLESHAPLDLLILMLGTNDLMPCYASSAADVAAGVGILLDIVATSGAGPSATAPAVLLVAPPRIKAAGMAFELGYAGVAEESVAVSEHYLALATARNCPYLDAAQVVSASDEDGVHLDAEAHGALAEAIAERVRSLL
jgi:lysophospholipase L1-like esterase